MKLLIMSDTHGDAEVIDRVRNYVPDAAAVVHCGDSELPYNHVYLEGTERVRGNCDRTEVRFPDERLFEVADTKIFVTHGHLFKVKSTLLPLTYRAKEQEADVCCFGHSHVLGAEMIEGILFINPGSLLKPRGRKEKTFVVLHIEPEQFTVNCYTDTNELIESLQFKRL